MTDYVPLYRWCRTWGEETGVDGKPHEDFADFDGDDSVGRIYKTYWFPISDKWKWNAAHPKMAKGSPALPNAGFADSAREACRRCKDYYHEVLARSKDNSSR